ncbi:hypothetical protein E2562_027890 [Oryza meyeriana var. granulata]|uniref:Uncharacterized protein n=1 Tax=Oryza meyeriana var. granulata TaxID=110450 RepID=A0A6G1CTS1_9ORYZ|nr:hypothetical protein E2562_027890 [Oryza meyeriana var. granulata]
MRKRGVFYSAIVECLLVGGTLPKLYRTGTEGQLGLGGTVLCCVAGGVALVVVVFKAMEVGFSLVLGPYCGLN